MDNKVTYSDNVQNIIDKLNYIFKFSKSWSQIKGLLLMIISAVITTSAILLAYRPMYMVYHIWARSGELPTPVYDNIWLIIALWFFWLSAVFFSMYASTKPSVFKFFTKKIKQSESETIWLVDLKNDVHLLSSVGNVPNYVKLWENLDNRIKNANVRIFNKLDFVIKNFGIAYKTEEDKEQMNVYMKIILETIFDKNINWGNTIFIIKGMLNLDEYKKAYPKNRTDFCGKLYGILAEMAIDSNYLMDSKTEHSTIHKIIGSILKTLNDGYTLDNMK